ncbi:hypothetical protein [Hymenobacter crusticola]|uniref:Uncharacterized protein n=1 Tax=Hymenobacter crusticola TaxID=1770526 RepID=A0A243WLW6_9BACT|nr:hypothetical protein [Hymenobacter crusticola]OUJ76101.1 hypothetical protein BXP70_02155 [Hymenobacter crusticola]
MKNVLASAHSFAPAATRADGPTSHSLASRIRQAALGLLLLGSISLTTPAVAQQTSPVTVTKADNTTLRLRIQNPEQQSNRVRVISLTTGQTLFYERFDAPAYGKCLDFASMQAGDYVVLMQLGKSTHRYMVRVNSNPQFSVVLRTVKVKTRLPKQDAAPEVMAATR